MSTKTIIILILVSCFLFFCNKPNEDQRNIHLSLKEQQLTIQAMQQAQPLVQYLDNEMNKIRPAIQQAVTTK